MSRLVLCGRSMFVLVGLVLVLSPVVGAQETDVAVVGKRLNKMVSKAQRTKPQADAMLATLMKMVGGQDDDTGKSENQPNVDSKTSLKELNFQKTLVTTGPDPRPELPFEFVAERIMKLIQQKQISIREHRYELQSQIVRLEESQKNNNRSVKTRLADIEKMKNMLSDAASEGEVVIAGKKYPMEALKIQAERSIKELAMVKSQIERDAQLVKINQEALLKLVAEEKLVGEQSKEVVAKLNQQRAKHVIEDSRKMTNEIYESLKELNRLIEKESNSLNLSPAKEKQ